MPRKHLFKIASLSLLAAVGMLAVSASAAQAKWLIKLGPNVVDLVELNVHYKTVTKLLVEELGLEIGCELTIGTTHIEASNGLKDYLYNLTDKLINCDDLVFGEVCDVRGTGDAAGNITFKGTGIGSMTGASDVKVSVSSTAGSPFANIEYTGAECPLTEIDGRLFGGMVIEMQNPSKHATSHGIAVVEQNLIFGGNSAELHNGEGNPVQGTSTHPEPISVTLSSL